MTSQPDYTIIDKCLEKVVRPEKMIGGHTVKLERATNSRALWRWTPGIGTAETLDDSDALAVVEKAVSEWLAWHPEVDMVQNRNLIGRDGFIFEALFMEPRITAAGHRKHGCSASHPDRTTALCLLALRVAGVEVTT